MTSPDILIWIVRETLSDGSEVCNVELPGGEKIAATSYGAATDLAQTIVDAINEHSTNIADVMEG